MSIHDQIYGNVFTTDESYMALTGRVVRRHVVEKLGITDDGYVIGRVRRYIDLGRPWHVTPVDADAAIADEPWERPTTVQATHGSKRKAAANHAAMERVIVALMQQHGPLPMKRLMALTGKSRNFLQAHFDERLGTVYEYYAANGKKFAFGLPGQSYTYRDAMRHEHA